MIFSPRAPHVYLFISLERIPAEGLAEVGIFLKNDKAWPRVNI